MEYEFSVESREGPTAIVQAMRRYGLAHVPGHLSDEETEALAAEARRILQVPPPWADEEEYGRGTAVRMVRDRIPTEEFRETTRVFGSGLHAGIVAGFYGDGHTFAEKVYAIEDVVGTETVVQQMHYDKVQHVKLFVYLSDVGAGNGPFHCVPGSHVHAKELQEANRQRRVIPTDQEARLLPPDVLDAQVAVLGSRGTMIAFDSDLAHRASVPTEGPRLAMRSLSFGPDSLGTRL